MQPRCWELLGHERYSPLLTLSYLILIFLWQDSCLLWSSRAPRHLWRPVGNLLVLTTLVSGPFLQQIIGKLLSLFQLWRQNIKNNLSSADRPSQSCTSIVTVRRLCCITITFSSTTLLLENLPFLFLGLSSIWGRPFLDCFHSKKLEELMHGLWMNLATSIGQ